MVGTIVSSLFAIFILCPFLVSIALLIIFKRMGKPPISMLGITADITTPILFFSVYILSHTIFEVGVGYMMITVGIVVTIVYTIYERMRVKEFRIIHLLRKIWRLLFLMLAFAYIVLLILGIVLQIVNYLQ